MEQKFDLMFCCLGNGTTVCNRAVTEHGDYKVIAHIDPCGAYKLRQKNLPQDVIDKIEKMARIDTGAYKDEYIKQSWGYLYENLLDAMSYTQYKAFCDNRTLSHYETPEQLYELYIKTVTERDGYTMPKGENK